MKHVVAHHDLHIFERSPELSGGRYPIRFDLERFSLDSVDEHILDAMQARPGCEQSEQKHQWSLEVREFELKELTSLDQT